jgi:hypothetical protein
VGIGIETRLGAGASYNTCDRLGQIVSGSLIPLL